MIRGPSDGSVKEPHKPAPACEGSLPSGESDPAVMPDLTGAGPILDTTTSGLPTGSSKPENIARLEKARQWIRDYRDGKFKKETERER